MKQRYGFVSNSSSSSFIINLNNITCTQKELLISINDYVITNGEGWNLYESGNNLIGETYMDNFDFKAILNELGIPYENGDF